MRIRIVKWARDPIGNWTARGVRPLYISISKHRQEDNLWHCYIEGDHLLGTLWRGMASTLAQAKKDVIKAARQILADTQERLDELDV